ncbi:hypothetical protein J4573_29320 [Actinomadura barringtoniae]|uniref:Uncharacterized protein n=1 Tax=Actinomadura barringtoniae TaxID=1427535 RepID=A0A939PEN7_9ACTN|nr:hypothetical protein [Actinomadura barringtoniae]MBO2451226.1 hypothetical protein [Actinomadura barringtoniae]
MSGSISPDEDAQEWPRDKLNALRLGQSLIAEVPGSGPGRQAFVVREATAIGEAALGEVVRAWGLRAGDFAYPWDTEDPT